MRPKLLSFILHPSCLLFALALTVRVIYALQIQFPPLDDPAYYIQAARALGGPHPLNFELSIIWNFEPLFPQVQHPGMEFWMPLSSFAIAFSMWLFGDNFFAAQLPSIISGSLLPIYTYFFARRFFSSRLSFVSGLLIVFNPLLAYQSVLPDSSMLYAALICPALLLMTSNKYQVTSNKSELGSMKSELAPEPSNNQQLTTNNPFTDNQQPTTDNPFLTQNSKLKTQNFLIGLLIGLAYLARTPAVFLAATYFLFMGRHWSILLTQNSKLKTQNFVTFLLGVGLPVMFWSVRNWLLFGYISSPAGTQTIFLFDYQDLFNYRNPVNFQSWTNAGLDRVIGVRLEALGSAWHVLDTLSPPTALIGVIGLGWLAKREAPARPAAIYTLLLFLGVPLIFAVASLNGSYYHSVGSCAPFLAVGQIYLITRFKWSIFPTRNLKSSIKYQVSSIKEKLEVGSMKSEATRNSQLATHNFLTDNLVPSNNQQLTTSNSIPSLTTDNRQPTTLKHSVPSPQSSVLIFVLILLNLVLLPLNASAAINIHRQDADLYGRIRDWLKVNPAAVVITNQPASLNYVSGVAAVRLPTNQDLKTLDEVAHKYAATYVIVTEITGRFPALLDAPENKLFPLVHQGGDFEVFAVPKI